MVTATQRVFFFDLPCPESKIKCLSGRVLSYWADKRNGTQNEILIYRMGCGAGRLAGAALISALGGLVGSIWHTVSAVIKTALFVLSGLLYYPTRLFSKTNSPQAGWQFSLEKFNHEMGISVVHHLGSAFVDLIRATFCGITTTTLHFTARPEDYISGQDLDWLRKPSSIDIIIPLLIR